MTTTSGPAADLAGLLDRWEREGLVTPEQAALLRADVAAHPPAPGAPSPAPTSAPPAAPSSGPGESLLTEALSYLGGVLVLVAGGLLTARFWEDLAAGSRVLLAAAATAVLLGGGLVVPARLGAAGRRVRAVLWVLAVAALAATIAVAAAQVADLEGALVGVLASGGAALLAAALWWRTRSAPQLLALVVTAAVFAATTSVDLLGDHEGVVPGLAVLAVAALAAEGARRGRLTPVRTAVAAAGAGGIFGALVTTGGEDAWSHLLAVAVVVAVVVAAVQRDDLPLLGIAAVGALAVLPQAVTRFFPGLVAAAVVLLVSGAALIGAGIAIAGRRAGPG